MNKQYKISVITGVVLFFIISCVFSDVYGLTFVTVGDPGNPPDPSTGYGSVNYTFKISAYEITNTDYAAMLNDVASSDPHKLYNSYMGGHEWDPATLGWVKFGGIVQKGEEGSYSYHVIAGYEKKPVVYVSWRDAARFANWLMTGDTESGAYDTSTFRGEREKRTDQTRHNPDAAFWIPTDNEWYKAAYYNGKGGYWLYAVQSNTPPKIERPPGGMHSVNGSYINPYPFLTDVGSYSDSVSCYGTWDQSGNLWEWTEDWETKGVFRSLRGGAYFDGKNPFVKSSIERMNSQWRYRHDPKYENHTLTFRIAASGIPGATPNERVMTLINQPAPTITIWDLKKYCFLSRTCIKHHWTFYAKLSIPILLFLGMMSFFIKKRAQKHTVLLH